MMSNQFRMMVVMIGVGLPVSDALAYIDPGTGSLLVQSLIGAVAAALATIGVFWDRVRIFFRRGERGKDVDQESDGE